MLQYVVPALASLAGTGAKYAIGSRNRTSRFGDTARGRLLQRWKEEGKYSPETRAKMVGRVANNTAGIAANQKAGIRGYLASRGMSNSISGAKLISSPETQHMNAVSRASENIEMANDQSKKVAEESLAAGKDQYAQARKAERDQLNAELFGGVTAGVAGLAQGVDRGIAMSKLETIPGFKEYALANRAGVRLPYGGIHVPKDLPDIPNLSEMNEDDVWSWAMNYPDKDKAKMAIDFWMINRGQTPTGVTPEQVGGL